MKKIFGNKIYHELSFPSEGLLFLNFSPAELKEVKNQYGDWRRRQITYLRKEFSWGSRGWGGGGEDGGVRICLKGLGLGWNYDIFSDIFESTSQTCTKFWCLNRFYERCCRTHWKILVRYHKMFESSCWTYFHWYS